MVAEILLVYESAPAAAATPGQEYQFGIEYGSISNSIAEIRLTAAEIAQIFVYDSTSSENVYS